MQGNTVPTLMGLTFFRDPRLTTIIAILRQTTKDKGSVWENTEPRAGLSPEATEGVPERETSAEICSSPESKLGKQESRGALQAGLKKLWDWREAAEAHCIPGTDKCWGAGVGKARTHRACRPCYWESIISYNARKATESWRKRWEDWIYLLQDDFVHNGEQSIYIYIYI